jgi:TolB protein
MTFIYGTGKQRRVYLMDADGHDPRAVSPENHVALMPAFGPGQKLHWLASINKDAYKVFTTGSNKPLNIQPRGSVYGLAFSRNRTKVAAAIARGPHIQLYAGPDLFHLRPAANNNTVLHPAWSPNGKLAYSGAGRYGQRIHVDGKPVSPDGLHATSPTFCRHPEGVRLVYMVGVNKNMDVVVTGETGGGLHRLTRGQGRNTYPACSPDGRLIAYFSTRKSGEGPGLYIMRIDGRRPKRISTLVGDSLSWARVPEPGKMGE